MLIISEKNGVLEVQEVQRSFLGTNKTFWYYDLKRKLVSNRGQEGDIPCRPMTQGQLDWALKHYVPQLSKKERSAVLPKKRQNLQMA